MSADFKNFTVPQFNGFEDAIDNEEEVENYFEHDHETDLYIKAGSTSSECEYEWFSSKDRHCTDLKNDSVFALRKSMSTGNLFVGKEHQRRLELIGNESQPVSQCDVRLGTNKKSGNGNKAGKQHDNRQRYVSVAEMASKFWMQTPDRFRSETKLVKTGSTIPKTPQLCTKNRARAVTILSREQLEELEMREAQKHQIKARPVNKKILAHPTMLIPLAKKDATIPKPFKLTEVHPKKTEQVPNVPQFHARAIPKSIYAVPKQLRVPLIPGGKPASHCSGKTKPTEKPPAQAKPLTTTDPLPFSFELRDKQTMKKKEDFINKIFEEEKKAREFKAKPVPKMIINKVNGNSTASIKSSKSDEDLDSANAKVFKATFPKVLYQEPFVPKKAEAKVLTEISTFQLNSELRAQERKEFDKKLQEKQERMNKIRIEREEEEKERQRVEIHNLRKEIEFKANPVRRFKEVHIQPSGKVTIPKSPIFKSVKKNKENISQ